MLDAYGREINYLRIAVTDRCNLRCLYCRTGTPASTGPSSFSLLSRRDIRAVAAEALRLGFTKVRLTGGEPLLRPDIAEIVRDLSSLDGLGETAVTTNGTRLAATAHALKKAGLTRLNVSLDSLHAPTYRRITGGSLDTVLSGLDAAAEAGFARTKINMVVMEGINEGEVPAMRRFCTARGLGLQLIKYYRLDEPKPEGAIPGFHRPPPCNTCNRIRLAADGTLRPCLFSDITVPLDREDIAGSLARAVRCKPEKGGVSLRGAIGIIGG